MDNQKYFAWSNDTKIKKNKRTSTAFYFRLCMYFSWSNNATLQSAPCFFSFLTSHQRVIPYVAVSFHFYIVSDGAHMFILYLFYSCRTLSSSFVGLFPFKQALRGIFRFLCSTSLSDIWGFYWSSLSITRVIVSRGCDLLDISIIYFEDFLSVSSYIPNGYKEENLLLSGMYCIIVPN